MKAKAPNRRDFLCTTGFVAVGLATGGSIILAPDYAWAMSTTSIDAHTAQTLLVMARQLFPHDRFGDQYYAAVVEAIDNQATGDAALRKLSPMALRALMVRAAFHGSSLATALAMRC